jgi:hypothetical protein
MDMRCKFKLEEIRVSEYTWGKVKKYIFTTVYDKSIPEDVNFSKATPQGTIEMVIDNPLVQARLKLGEAYYFDATHAPVQVIPAQAC